MPTWAYLLFAAIVWLIAYLVWNEIRVRKLIEARQGETFESFRTSCALEEVPEEILVAVYAKMQFYMFEAFPVRAQDDLGKIYGLDADELEDVINQLLAECHRQLPPNFAELTPVIVNTVRDLALVVEASPFKPTQ